MYNIVSKKCEHLPLQMRLRNIFLYIKSFMSRAVNLSFYEMMTLVTGNVWQSLLQKNDTWCHKTLTFFPQKLKTLLTGTGSLDNK
jgi:hypothetical protein